MKRIITIALTVIAVTGVLWVAKAWTFKRSDPNIARFNSDCDSLIRGLQEYKKFVGAYPTGNNISIVKALLGQTEKKVFIPVVKSNDINDKGEVMDPWGVPLQFYFSHNEVLIRSAGPNKVWEDATVQTADDLYRSVGKEK